MLHENTVAQPGPRSAQYHPINRHRTIFVPQKTLAPPDLLPGKDLEFGLGHRLISSQPNPD